MARPFTRCWSMVKTPRFTDQMTMAMSRSLTPFGKECKVKRWMHALCVASLQVMMKKQPYRWSPANVCIGYTNPVFLHTTLMQKLLISSYTQNVLSISIIIIVKCSHYYYCYIIIIIITIIIISFLFYILTIVVIKYISTELVFED